jgi:hypothetical protein
MGDDELAAHIRYLVNSPRSPVSDAEEALATLVG